MKNERLLQALTAFRDGDFSVRLPEDGKEIDTETAAVFNSFADRMNKLVSEVNRIALEIGEHGRLGGQADVDGLSGKWAEMYGNVNQLAFALTLNLRGIHEMVDSLLDEEMRYPYRGQNEIQRLRHDVDRLRYHTRKVKA